MFLVLILSFLRLICILICFFFWKYFLPPTLHLFKTICNSFTMHLALPFLIWFSHHICPHRNLIIVYVIQNSYLLLPLILSLPHTTLFDLTLPHTAFFDFTLPHTTLFAFLYRDVVTVRKEDVAIRDFTFPYTPCSGGQLLSIEAVTVYKC